MKIEIKLKDANYCNGCPCWNYNPEYGDNCNLEYWNNEQVGYMGTLSEAKCVYCLKYVSDKDKWEDCPKRSPKTYHTYSNYPRKH